MGVHLTRRAPRGRAPYGRVPWGAYLVGAPYWACTSPCVWARGCTSLCAYLVGRVPYNDVPGVPIASIHEQTLWQVIWDEGSRQVGLGKVS
jgi:hypothetical protein